ncbi:MAG: pilus assembly protein PilM [Omnitrophica bacterium]|nr:pilus assembly protein PilM [Candidatus Omnitrophota bacterium]
MFGKKKKIIKASFQMSSKDIIGINISGNSLKLAHLKNIHRRPEIVNIFRKDITGLSDENISEAIASCFSQQNLKTVNIIAIIPSQLVITKNIEVPSRNPQEIKDIIGLQAGRHTPYSREEVIIDYIDIGTYKDNYTKILLVIAARNVIKRQCSIFERAGIRLEKVLFAPEAIGRFISRVRKFESENTPSVIVHVDQNFTDFLIVLSGRVIYIRNIPIGTEHLLKEKDHQQLRLIDEIRKSLESYTLEDIAKTPQNIILTGVTEQVKELMPILANSLHIPIEVIDYLEYLPLAQEVLKSTTSDIVQASFLDVTAAVFIINEARFDFTPKEIKLRREFEERSKDIIKTGILVFTAFALICSILASKIYFKSVYLGKLNKKYEILHREAKKLEKNFEKVKLARSYLSNRGYSLEVLVELYNVIPLNAQLNDIRFDIKGNLLIKGTANLLATVFSLVENMEKSDFFKDVENKYTTKRKEGLRDVTDFEIICLFAKGGS